MTYTIDQVKRLVPEATYVAGNVVDGVYFTIENYRYFSDSEPGSLILTTRHQLAIAREALEAIAEHDLDSPIAVQICREALDATAKADQ